MYGESGFHINRFGEEITGSKDSDAVSTQYVDLKLLELQTEFNDRAKSMFTVIEKNLKTHLTKADELMSGVELTNNYLSVKNRRIVSAARALAKFDVVVKEQLDEIDSKIKGPLKLSHNIAVKTGTKANDFGSLELKTRKRISNVGLGISENDVVVLKQLEDLRVLHNELKQRIDREFNTLQMWKRNCGEQVSELYVKVFGAKQDENQL